MKNIFVAVTVAFVLVVTGCRSETSTKPAKDSSTAESASTQDAPKPAVPLTDPKARAIAAKNALVEQLSGKLVRAMSTKGPAAAIEVCSNEASKIATSVGEKHGVKIGRTSLKTTQPSKRTACVGRAPARKICCRAAARRPARRSHGRLAADQAAGKMLVLPRPNRADPRQNPKPARQTLPRRSSHRFPGRRPTRLVLGRSASPLNLCPYSPFTLTFLNIYLNIVPWAIYGPFPRSGIRPVL